MDVFLGKKFTSLSRWLKEKVYKKVMVAYLACYKKIDVQIQHLHGEFEHKFEQTNLERFKCPEGCPKERGMLKL